MANRFLEMLLSRKRPGNMDEQGGIWEDPSQMPSSTGPTSVGPTIPLGGRQPAPPIVPIDPGFTPPPSQEPTIPLSLKSAMPTNEGLAPAPPELMEGKVAPMAPSVVEPTIAIKPRSGVETAADEVRKYDQGLHKDPKTGEWVEHKRNKGLQILEGLGTVAAGSVGIPLRSILHPRGTPEQQARRRLQTEVGLEDQDLQRRGAEANITRDEAYTRKLGEPEKPTANAKYVERSDGVYEISAEHPEGRKVSGIPSEVREAKEAAGFSLGQGEARFDHTGKLIVERAPKAEPGSEDVPDTTAGLAELESGFRTNATAAQKAAEAAEAQVKQYTQQQKALNKDYDPADDPNVASMTAEARRQRDLATDQLKNADAVAIKKVEAGNKVATGRAKARSKAGPVRPAKDGKYHYSMADIQATIGPNGKSASGKTLEQVLQELKANPKVAIEE